MLFMIITSECRRQKMNFNYIGRKLRPMLYICVKVGTSSVVYPAAMFAPTVAKRGMPVAEFNIEPTSVTGHFGFVKKKCYCVENISPSVFADKQLTINQHQYTVNNVCFCIVSFMPKAEGYKISVVRPSIFYLSQFLFLDYALYPEIFIHTYTLTQFIWRGI